MKNGGTRRKRTMRKVARKKVSKPLKLAINRALSSKLETKMCSVALTQSGFLGGGQTPPYKVLPPISEGTRQQNRVGSKISPMKLEIRGFIHFNKDALTIGQAFLQGIQLFLVQEKEAKSYAVQDIAGINGNYIDYGGDATPLTGTTQDHNAPLNTAGFKWLSKKRFQMTKPFGTYYSTGSDNLLYIDKSMYRPFLITLTQKDLPAALFYESGTSTYPENFAPRFQASYCDLVTNSNSSPTNQLFLISYVSTLYYKDA